MLAVSGARVLELLANACARYRLEGERGAQWVLCGMTDAERDAFDQYLVRTHDPLASEAGTVSRRFVKRVQHMVETDDPASWASSSWAFLAVLESALQWRLVSPDVLPHRGLDDSGTDDAIAARIFADAGVDSKRWADVNRKFNQLLSGGNT